MGVLQQLRDYLAPYAQAHPLDEPFCTCGDANHVRMLVFRVAGRPATLIVPEAATPTLDQVREAFGETRVECLSEAELDAMFTENDLGRQTTFANPFGTSVFIDESLILYPTLVFCPRMFGGQQGECFRVPTHGLLDKLQATALPLVPEPCISDDWAV